MYFCVALLIILKGVATVCGGDDTSTVEIITVKLLTEEGRCESAPKLVVFSNRTLSVQVILDADDVLSNVSCLDNTTTSSYGGDNTTTNYYGTDSTTTNSNGTYLLKEFNASKVANLGNRNFLATFQDPWPPSSRWLCTFAVSERNIVCDLPIHVRSEIAFFTVNGYSNNKTHLDYDARLMYEYNYTEGEVLRIRPFKDFTINNASMVQDSETLFSFNFINILMINTNFIKGIFWVYFTAKDKYEQFYAVKLKLSPLLDPIRLNGMLHITDEGIVINSVKRNGSVYHYFQSYESCRFRHIRCEKRSSDSSLILEMVDEFGNRIQGENKVEMDLKLKPNFETSKMICILKDYKEQIIEAHFIFLKLDVDKGYLTISSYSWNRTIYIANDQMALTYNENEVLKVYCFSLNVSRETCSIAWFFREKVISGSTIVEDNMCINSKEFVLTKKDDDTTIVCFNNKTHDTVFAKLFLNYPNYLDVVSVSAHWLWVAVPIIALTIMVASKCLHWKRNKASTEVGKGCALTEEHLYDEIPDPTYNVVYDHRR